jgi:hypothetical protein
MRFSAEVNGSVASAVYQMGDPNNLLFGKGTRLFAMPFYPQNDDHFTKTGSGQT